ncbi:IgE-binding protein [Colletotrichum sojae]|uniref:IgE-binding protein n=1 Tax=Colletotrichum sojae TaxID=2175907 RepID=A0A8H6MJ42_9PEZI|nr:IgE-binding protein [Colletotrichum sojae]
MAINLLLPLLAIASLAVAESFTLTAYAPGHRAIHGQPINADGSHFLIGLEVPFTYCPALPSISCPPGVSTVVDEDLTHLRVATPGGQAIYIPPSGLVSYTRAHSSYMPPGSTIAGFYAKVLASDCSAEVSRVLDFVSADGTGLAGVYACPNPDTPNTWLLVAAGRQSRALRGDCVLLEGLEMRASDVDIGAWQY